MSVELHLTIAEYFQFSLFKIRLFLQFLFVSTGGGEKRESSPGGAGSSQEVAPAEAELTNVESGTRSEHQDYLGGEGQAGKVESANSPNYQFVSSVICILSSEEFWENYLDLSFKFELEL